MRSSKQLTIALLVGSIKAGALKQKDAPAPLETTQAFYASSSDAPIQAGFLQTKDSIDLKKLNPESLAKSTQKVEQKATEAKKVEQKPVEAKKVEAKPAEAKKVEAKPVEAKKVEVKPVEAKKVEAKAATTKTVELKKVDSKTVEAKPVEAKKVEVKPVEAKKIEAKPVELKKVEQKPAEVKPTVVKKEAPKELKKEEKKVETKKEEKKVEKVAEKKEDKKAEVKKEQIKLVQKKDDAKKEEKKDETKPAAKEEAKVPAKEEAKAPAKEEAKAPAKEEAKAPAKVENDEAADKAKAEKNKKEEGDQQTKDALKKLAPADTSEKITPLTNEEVSAIASSSPGFHPGPPGIPEAAPAAAPATPAAAPAAPAAASAAPAAPSAAPAAPAAASAAPAAPSAAPATPAAAPEATEATKSEAPAKEEKVQVSACEASGVTGVVCAPPNSQFVSWIDDYESIKKGEDKLDDSVKMIDNQTSSLKTQDFVQTQWIDQAMKGDENIGQSIKMKDDIEMDFSNQDLVQVHHRLPVDLAAAKVHDNWGAAMESLGIMNERTDYTPIKERGQGYFTLHSNNADDAAEVKWEPIAPLEELASDETEKVFSIQPLSYQDRAIMNYFGYRTTFYGQLAQDIHTEEDMSPHYNQEAGVWMGPSLIQTESALPVDDAFDKVQDRWEEVMMSHGHMNAVTDYTSQRVPGEGYYTLKTNNAAEADVPTVWKNDPLPVYNQPAEDETERVSILQPLSYQSRADNNFFGGRTAFYNQIGSELNEKEGVQIQNAPVYNEKYGLWMGPSLIQLPVEDAADKIQDNWGSVMEQHGHMNLRTDYTSPRIAGEGFYTLKSNNAAEAGVSPPWPETPYVAPAAPAEDETERVSVLQPTSYESRANNNYFGGRTAFYAQTDSKINNNEPSMVQIQSETPYGDAVEKVNQRWEDVMMSWGHMKADPTDGYNPHKLAAEGYYVGKNQDPDFKENGSPVDNNAEDSIENVEEGGEDARNDITPEKVSTLQPLSYLRRADNNFFGGRTAFYAQLDSEIRKEDAEDDVVDEQVAAENASASTNEGDETSAGNDGDIEPEQLSILDPEAYELRAMMNTPNFRTTFYGATKGVEETADLLKLRSKHNKANKNKHNKRTTLKHKKTGVKK